MKAIVRQPLGCHADREKYRSDNHFGVTCDLRKTLSEKERKKKRTRKVKAGFSINQWAAILAVLYDSYSLNAGKFKVAKEASMFAA